MDKERLLNFGKQVARNPLARFTLVVASVVSTGSACADESFKDGTVIEKRHEDDKTWVQIIPMPYQICTSVGKIRSCNTYYNYIPFVHHDDEDWIVKLKHCETDENEEEKCKTKDFYISEDIFNGLKEGNYANFGSNEDEASTNDPIEKSRQ